MIKKLCALLIGSLLISNAVYAQLQTQTWYFGFNAGITFSTNPPTALLNGALSTNEGCATLSDAAGNLIMYTDGMRVYNRLHQQMPNGFGLLGDPSSAQSGIIVPRPGQANKYYIFTVAAEGTPNGFRYSEVDMSLNGGLGDVISATKNTLLFAPSVEKIAAVLHANAQSVWVLAHGIDNNRFYAYLVNSTGVNPPVISNVGSVEGRPGWGCMAVSADGRRLATAMRNVGFEVLDFDNSTGVVSNPLLLSSQVGCYGVAFSPDSKLLYACNIETGGIFQWNLMAGNSAAIISSRIQIGTGQGAPGNYRGGAIQAGLDGKLYLPHCSQPFLSVINNPNVIGTGCNLQHNAVNLQGRNAVLGLPPFIQSFFAPPQICPFNPLPDTIRLCGNSLTLDAGAGYTSYSWNTGASTQTIPVNTPGQYIVSVVGTDGCVASDTVYASILNAQIQQSDTTICQGVSMTVSIPSPAGVTGCTGIPKQVYRNWTSIAPAGDYRNLIRHNDKYYLRSQSDVFTSDNIDGPYTSLGFASQLGITGAGSMLGIDNNGWVHIATAHNGVYLFNGSSWFFSGLSGFGTAGGYFTMLPNGRILISKTGSLRSIYYSDNSGTSWTNATNNDVDWTHITRANNENLFACSGAGGVGQKGVIKSVNNGQTWTYINAQLSISKGSAVAKDCSGKLYIAADQKLFTSSDDGNTWTQFASLPSLFTSSPDYGHLLIASNREIYYWGLLPSGASGLFVSADNGASWNQVNGIPGNFNYMREVDGHLVVCTSTGVYAKTLSNLVSILWSTGATTPSISVTPTQTTSYHVAVSDGISICRDTITVTVNAISFNPLPDTTRICGDTVLLDAGPGFTSYSWNTGATTRTIRADSSGLYKVTVTSPAGCAARDSTLVNFLNRKIANNDTTVCSGTSLFIYVDSLDNNVVDSLIRPGDNWEYTFTPPTGNWKTTIGGWTTGNAPFGNANPANPPEFTAVTNWAVYTPLFVRKRINLRQYDLTNIRWFLGVDNGYTLYVNGTQISAGVAEGFTFRWEYSGQVPPALLTNGDTYVAIELVDNGGLTAFDMMMTGRFNQRPLRYLWSTGATTAGIRVSPTQTTTYYVDITDGITTCRDSMVVTVRPNPTVDQPAQQTYCNGVLVPGINFTGSVAGTQYNWTSSNPAIGLSATSGSGSIPAFVATNSGTTPITSTITVTPRVDGCVGTPISFVITIQPKPAVAVIQDLTICGGATVPAVTLSGPIAGTTYSWTNNDPSIGLPASGTGNIPSFVAVNSTGSPRSASISVVPTLNGCQGSAVSYTITVNPTPVVATVPNSVVCSGDQVLPINLQSQVAGTVFNWTNSNSSVGLAATGNTAVIPAFTAINVGATPAVATITVQSQSNGCNGNPYSFTISVNPLPSGSITSTTTFICEGSTQLLTASGGNSYQWFLGGNPIPSAVQPTFSASLPGTYSVRLLNSFGCSSMSSNLVSLSLRVRPQAAFAFDRYCVGLPVTFRDQSVIAQVGNVNYNWSFGVVGATSTLQNPQYTYSQAGNYTVSLTITPQDCPSLASQTSQVLAVRNPPSGIRYPTVDAIKNKDQLLQARSFSGASYAWVPSSGLNNPSVRTPTFNYDREMDYQIRILTLEGCRVTDSLLVRIFPESGIFVATAFSPNNDGQNDKLYPRLVGITTLKIFRVYNRWGQLMFQTNIEGSGWDGKFKGVDQPMDTYAWVAEGLDNEGKLIRKTGVSSLLR